MNAADRLKRGRRAAIPDAADTPVGLVTGIDRERVTVRVDPGRACRRCAAGRGCGAGLLAGPGSARELVLERPAGRNLAVGDRVTLALAPERLLKAALSAYGLPLAALLLVPLAAERFRGPLDDVSLIALAAGGLLGGMVAARRLLASDDCPADFEPSIGRSVPAAPDR